jgi:hypothetical protein
MTTEVQYFASQVQQQTEIQNCGVLKTNATHFVNLDQCLTGFVNILLQFQQLDWLGVGIRAGTMCTRFHERVRRHVTNVEFFAPG